MGAAVAIRGVDASIRIRHHDDVARHQHRRRDANGFCGFGSGVVLGSVVVVGRRTAVVRHIIISRRRGRGRIGRRSRRGDAFLRRSGVGREAPRAVPAKYVRVSLSFNATLRNALELPPARLALQAELYTDEPLTWRTLDAYVDDPDTLCRLVQWRGSCPGTFHQTMLQAVGGWSGFTSCIASSARFRNGLLLAERWPYFKPPPARLGTRSRAQPDVVVEATAVEAEAVVV